MTLAYDDGQARFYLGDVREELRSMDAESVQCVVSSPPYWGLRDYGTAQWDGGDAECSHIGGLDKPRSERPLGAFHGGDDRFLATPYRDVCGKCGARRIDSQLGLEPAPELFIEHMVEVFREVRRVLAKDGTLWLNIGDSYASGGMSNPSATSTLGGGKDRGAAGYSIARDVPPGLKPKDLVGIPWMLAFALRADGWWLRSAITWCKKNPMPESVTDRPTKATEMVFLFSKSSKYYFDQTALSAACAGDADAIGEVQYGDEALHHLQREQAPHRVLSSQGRGEPGRNVQGVRQGSHEGVAGYSGGRGIGTNGDEEVQRERSREEEEEGVQPNRSASPGSSKVRPLGEGEGVGGTPPANGKAQGRTAALLRQREGQGGDSPIPGDGEGQGIATPRRSQAAGGASGLDANGERVGSDSGGLPQPMRLLWGEGQSVDTGSPGPLVEGRPARSGKHRSSVPQLQRQEGGPVASYPNARDFWLLATEAFTEAHFATFPSAIPRRAILAGTSEHGCCSVCGAQWERVVEREGGDYYVTGKSSEKQAQGLKTSLSGYGPGGPPTTRTTGWRATCAHTDAPVRPAVVLDPFLGSGTTAMVAKRLGRRAIGIDLNAEYLEMAKRRCAQMALMEPV